jgi:hypothetical protein
MGTVPGKRSESEDGDRHGKDSGTFEEEQVSKVRGHLFLVLPTQSRGAFQANVLAFTWLSSIANYEDQVTVEYRSRNTLESPHCLLNS